MTEATRDLLYGVQDNLQIIMHLRSRKEELESSLLASGIRYDSIHVQTSPKDMMPETMAKIAEVDRQIKEAVRERDRAAQKIEKACGCLTLEEKTVIMRYYVAGKKMEQIANEMKYGLSTVYKMRSEAQKKLDKNAKKQEE